jgi:hypothetical protein
MARNAGFNGLFLVGHTLYSRETDAIRALGFDAVNIVPIGDVKRNIGLGLRHLPSLIRHLRGRSPLVYDYARAIRVFASAIMKREDVVPTLLPNWDHSPRSKNKALVLHDAHPQAFDAHVKAIRQIVDHKHNPLVLLKSWNEWSEGNYMEPDNRYANRIR